MTGKRDNLSSIIRRTGNLTYGASNHSKGVSHQPNDHSNPPDDASNQPYDAAKLDYDTANQLYDAVKQPNAAAKQPNDATDHFEASAYTDTASKDKPDRQSITPACAHQVVLVLLASTTLMMNGSILAFPSVIITDLLENNSTIFGTSMTFTDTQQDLIGSITSMGGLVGVWAGGLTMGRLGRIPIFIVLAVLGSISWVGLGLSPNPELCLLFRGLSGVVYGGVSISGVTYIVEITDDVVRCSLTLLASASITTGQAISVIPAHWLRYYTVTFINCIFPIALLSSVVFILPESPTVLLMKGRDEKARNVLLSLRGKDADVDAEIRACRKSNEQHQNVNVLQSLRQKDVLIRLGLVCLLFVFQVFSGYTIFVAQTARIIQDSGGTVEASLSTILVQGAQLLGIFITMTFVNRLGRRGCLLLSHAVMAASVGALALFTLSVAADENTSMWGESNPFRNLNGTGTELLFMSTSSVKMVLKPNITSAGVEDSEGAFSESPPYGWVPLFCIMLAQFGAGIGVQNVPFILASEYFPTTIRPQASSICVSVAMLLGVANLQLYTPLQKLLSQSGLLLLHCGVSLLAIPFTYFCVQETVGKEVG